MAGNTTTRVRTWANAPSPCIDVCKYRANGECIGCAMTKPEKRRWKRLKGKAERKPFLRLLVERLQAERRYDKWARQYRRRCARKERPCPLDKLEVRTTVLKKAA